MGEGVSVTRSWPIDLVLCHRPGAFVALEMGTFPTGPRIAQHGPKFAFVLTERLLNQHIL